MINRKAAFVLAANYRTDVRSFQVYNNAYSVRFYNRDPECGSVILDELDPDKTFGQVLTDLLGEEPPFREDKRDTRWCDARAAMRDLKVRETVI